MFSASAFALTVTTSLAPLAVIEVAAEPVVMRSCCRPHCPWSRSAPRSATSRDIADQAADCSRRAGRASASCSAPARSHDCHHIGAELSLIEVAAEPVVIAMVLSVASPCSRSAPRSVN